MTDSLNKTIVLVLNRNWQAINIRAPKELPVTAHLRNCHGVAEWKLFLNE